MQVDIKFTIYKEKNLYSINVEGSNVVSLYLKHYLSLIIKKELLEYELRTVNQDYIIFDILSINILLEILIIMRFNENQIADVKNMLDSKYVYDKYSTIITY